jgi:hypothetical protein
MDDNRIPKAQITPSGETKENMEKLSEGRCTKESRERVDTVTRGVFMGRERRMERAWWKLQWMIMMGFHFTKSF